MMIDAHSNPRPPENESIPLSTHAVRRFCTHAQRQFAMQGGDSFARITAATELAFTLLDDILAFNSQAASMVTPTDQFLALKQRALLRGSKEGTDAAQPMIPSTTSPEGIVHTVQAIREVLMRNSGNASLDEMDCRATGRSLAEILLIVTTRSRRHSSLQVRSITKDSLDNWLVTQEARAQQPPQPTRETRQSGVGRFIRLRREPGNS